MHKMFTFNDTTGQCGDIIQHASGFMPYAHKKLGFSKPVGVNFISDPENAKNAFGKTGYYDPNKMEITIFVDKRHVKDILRSLSHELVHHTQNCRGEFDQGINTGDGYAQKDPHMRKMEAEAYLLGNGFLFRDYEDQLKENKAMANKKIKVVLKEQKKQHKRKNIIIESLLDEEILNKLTNKVFKALKEQENPLRGKPAGKPKKGKPPIPGELAKKLKGPKVRDAEIVPVPADDTDDDETVDEGKGKCPGGCGKNEECAKTPDGKYECQPEGGGCVSEGEKPDFLDLDNDGDEKESMKDAADDAKNENWFKGNKDQLLFEELTKKWTK